MILALPLLPLLGALVLLGIPAHRENWLRAVTLASTVLCFLITLALFSTFQAGKPGFQFYHSIAWLPAWGIHYQVGLDGINLTLCLLHALVSFAGVFLAIKTQDRLKDYLFFYLLLVAPIYGVFTSLNIFFLYMFYEMTLIPLYPMIGIWGSKNKEYGAMKLTIYITAGAVLSLFGIMLLYQAMGSATFDLVKTAEILRQSPLSPDFQKVAAGLFLAGFGVIASLWPLHSWSPIGYAAAPTSVSMLHAGVLKKMGPYLMIRLAIMLVPTGVKAWSPLLATLAGIGILYAGFAAIRQKDMKFMVGFSSVSHMGYVLLGIAALTQTSLAGAVLLMFSHGVMAACFFALIGFIYEQAHTRGVTDFGGLGKTMPFIAVSFTLVSLASLGLPGFSNFAAELLVFIGSWRSYPWIVVCGVFAILITAIYLLRAVQSVCYGPANPKWKDLRDAVTFTEKFPFLLLIGALLLFGFWPQGLLRILLPAVKGVLS